MELKSILTDDFEHCYVSGRTPVAIHHIFNKYNKKRSEEYGFLVPLHPDYHTGKYGVHTGNIKLDKELKCACQEWWLEHGRTQEEWIAEFGKWNLPFEETEVPKIF